MKTPSSPKKVIVAQTINQINNISITLDRLQGINPTNAEAFTKRFAEAQKITDAKWKKQVLDTLASDIEVYPARSSALSEVILLLKKNKHQVSDKLNCHTLYDEMLAKIEDAQGSYEQNKNSSRLKRVCTSVIEDTIKNTYNTHRDTGVKKVFGDVLHAVKNFFDFLFSPQAFKNNEQALGFFNTQQRITRSGHALYELHLALEKVTNIEEQNNNLGM